MKRLRSFRRTGPTPAGLGSSVKPIPALAIQPAPDAPTASPGAGSRGVLHLHTILPKNTGQVLWGGHGSLSRIPGHLEVPGVHSPGIARGRSARSAWPPGSGRGTSRQGSGSVSSRVCSPGGWRGTAVGGGNEAGRYACCLTCTRPSPWESSEPPASPGGAGDAGMWLCLLSPSGRCEGHRCTPPPTAKGWSPTRTHTGPTAPLPRLQVIPETLLVTHAHSG